MNSGNIIKMSLTLMIVGVISALVLNFTHGVTAPIIEEQAIIAIEETMFEFFPEADEVDFEETEDYVFQYALKDGEKIGVATMATSGGYGGDINIIVALDMQGNIKGINVISHSETPGIGDIVEEEDFTDQFAGIDPDKSISSEVDVVSGATVTVVAVISGVEKGRELILEQVGLSEKVEDVAVSDVPDGTYRGEGQGFMGPVVVEVTVEGGKLVDIVEIENSDEPPEYFDEAWEGVTEDVLESQSTDVDVVSGSTASSRGIKVAIQNALNSSVE